MNLVRAPQVVESAENVAREACELWLLDARHHREHVRERADVHQLERDRDGALLEECAMEGDALMIWWARKWLRGEKGLLRGQCNALVQSQSQWHATAH